MYLNFKFYFALMLLHLIVSDVYSLEIDVSDHWVNFKRIYGKSYEKDHDALREFIFQDNVKFIVKHNLEADLGMHSYRLGINHLADLSHDEYKKKYLTKIDVSEIEDLMEEVPMDFCSVETKTAEENVDYRKEGLVTEVKNQGDCGSCYCFACTGALEAQWKRKSGTLISLSDQQILDCSGPEGNRGCKGGNMEYGYEYVKKSGGLEATKDYEYEPKQNDCRFEKEKVVASITGYKSLKRYDEIELLNAVKTIGPIACSVNGINAEFQFYAGGIFDEPKCNTSINHAVTMIGYGTEGDKEYWLLKNQWKVDWGEEGFMRLARNKNNMCGIASYSFYPTV